MKNIICLSGLLFVLFSCSKEDLSLRKGSTAKPTTTQFTKYTIRAGQNYCDENKFTSTSYSELKFIARFDNSAIYTNVNPDNQLDINKLYGFSDNNSLSHQQYSARFGWRWSDNAIRIFGYVYNNGARESKELGTVAPGTENSYSIKVTPKSYVFALNGVVDSLPRTSTTATANGYKLYPYFGGDESAPQTIYIWIKE